MSIHTRVFISRFSLPDQRTQRQLSDDRRLCSPKFSTPGIWGKRRQIISRSCARGSDVTRAGRTSLPGDSGARFPACKENAPLVRSGDEGGSNETPVPLEWNRQLRPLTITLSGCPFVSNAFSMLHLNKKRSLPVTLNIL